MNLLIPVMCDALVTALRASPDLVGVTVLDGPAAQDASNEGLAVGASLEDLAADFAAIPSDMASDSGLQITLTSLAWVRTGETTFTRARTRANQLFMAAAAALAADRTLAGVVSTAWIAGGAFDQRQTGSGAMVTVEFRIEATAF